MNLPQSIQEQAEYAEALGKKFAGAPAEAQTEETEPKQQPQDQVPVNEEKQNEVDEMEKLRNRYSSLQGKYNSEVPRLSARNRELETQLQKLAEDNRKLREEFANREASRGYLTQSDSDEFGADMVDLVRRGAKEELKGYSAQTARLQAEVDQLKNQLQQTRQQADDAALDRFYAEMTQECPEWREQNTDKDFIAWLDQVDPVLGISRHEALNNAASQLNGHQAAVIFNTYRTWKQQKVSNNPLARQVSPSHKAAAAAPSGGARRWTQESIAQFYEAVRRREIPADKAKAIEQEIDAAVAQGLVS